MDSHSSSGSMQPAPRALVVDTPSTTVGRPISFVWGLFTREDKPWKKKNAVCSHCEKDILYHKKSEYVLGHLKKCEAFRNYCTETNQLDLIEFVALSAEASKSKQKGAKARMASAAADRPQESNPMMGSFGPAAPLAAAPFEAAEVAEDGVPVVDLANGNPAASSLPVTMVRQANDAMMQYMAADLEEGETSHPMAKGEDTNYFTEALAAYLSCRADRVVACAGISDGLERLTILLLKRNGHRRGGFVYVEEHTYLPAVQIFRDHNLAVRTVRSDAEGACVADLREQLEARARAGEEAPGWPLLLYIIPSFASPTGRMTSHRRRTDLLSLARAHGLAVVADEVYGMLDFSKELDLLRARERYRLLQTLPPEACREPVVSLADMGYDNVFSLGSFSKVLCPGLRVGWIESSNDVDAVELKQMGLERSGGCMCQLTSCLVASILQLSTSHSHVMQTATAAIPSPARLDGNILFSGHLSTLRQQLARRYDALTAALIKYGKTLPAVPDGDLVMDGYENYLTVATASASAAAAALASRTCSCFVSASAHPGGEVSATDDSAPDMPPNGPLNGPLCAPLNGPTNDPPVGPDIGAKEGAIESAVEDGPASAPVETGGREAAGPTHRTGGYFLWVRLPQWVQRVAIALAAEPHASARPDKRRRVDAPPGPALPEEQCGSQYTPHFQPAQHPQYSNTKYPYSLEWLSALAWERYLLRIRLDSDCSPHDAPCTGRQEDLSEQPRFLRLCFARLDEPMLAEGAKRLCLLLRDVYKEHRDVLV